MFNAASAGVLALQLDSLMVPVEVLGTPLQTFMVTVTAPTPGEATFAAAPTAVVHDADAVGVGVADLVGVGLAVGDWVGVPGWDGLAVPVGSPVPVGLGHCGRLRRQSNQPWCRLVVRFSSRLLVGRAEAPPQLPLGRADGSPGRSDDPADGLVEAQISSVPQPVSPAEAGTASFRPISSVEPATVLTIATVVLRRTVFSEHGEEWPQPDTGTSRGGAGGPVTRAWWYEGCAGRRDSDRAEVSWPSGPAH